jgi:hypothetical protein
MRYENLDNDSSLANDSPFLLVNRNSALDLQRLTFNPEMKTEVNLFNHFFANLFTINSAIIIIDRLSLTISW